MPLITPPFSHRLFSTRRCSSIQTKAGNDNSHIHTDLDALDHESFPNHIRWKHFSLCIAHMKRVSSITKKTAPLKLYANVVGKFTVDRELYGDVYDKLRESTHDTVNQGMTPTLSSTCSRNNLTVKNERSHFYPPLCFADLSVCLIS